MDERAFARTAEEYATRLFAVAYRLLGNRSDAEDAVQRALLKAYEARESYSSRWAVSTWPYRVLTNVCVHELLRRRRTPPEALPRRGAGPPARRVVRLHPGRGDHGATARARAHAERARRELREYLAGRRTFFTVAVDLGGVGEFQSRVLAEALRIPFGEVDSYSALARRVGHPRAARAVGNALGANPVPVIVPCHRIVRGDGTWGHYAFGGAMKTQLLRPERTTPAFIGCTSTPIIC